MALKVFNPEIFQGNIKCKNYFEGWYYKHVTSDMDHVWSFIPGISLNSTDPHSFIQVINGVTGESDYVAYPLDEFAWDKKKFWIRVGRSIFTGSGIELDIEKDNLRIRGTLGYRNIVKYPRTILSPGIMGWYSYIPTMECKHGIVSVNHEIEGRLHINDKAIDFTGGKGYIEKDWGISFPEAWLWMQANNFTARESSFAFSVAKIPWRSSYFTGFISFLYYRGNFYLYSTYNNSVIFDFNHSESSIELKMKNRNSILHIIASKKTFGELLAPVSGRMSRRIKESIDSDLTVSLHEINGPVLYTDSSKRAGLEVVPEIFDYIRH